jgi:acyl-CoA dehydrogenase
MLDFTLTPEQLELQKRARHFAKSEILPIVSYFDEVDVMPLFILKRAYEAGLMNLGIPVQYGGKGLGLIDQAIVVEEIAAACVGMATSIFDNSLGSEPVIMSSNESVKQYLPKIANTFKLISFATSEPLMGSDVSGIQCRAEQDGSDWILTGTKYWITNGGYADYFSVFATADSERGYKGICAFLVEKEWDGITISNPIPKMGLKTSNTAGLHFNKVRVPEENVLAPPGEGFLLAMKTFARTRPIIGAFATGAARSAMEYALHHAKKRRAFNEEIKNFEAIQFKIAEMYQKVETARLLTWKAAWEADSGLDPLVAASISKFYGTEAAFEVVDQALQILGGYGYSTFFPIEKIYRDIRVLRIYEGTSEIQRILISRHAVNQYELVMPPLEDLPRIRAEDPEKASKEGIKGEKTFRCRICGYTHYGEELPEKCPYCGFPQTVFKQVWPQP